MSDISASVLAKLKEKSKEKGIGLQQLLNLFCQEEFIRRLSKSEYKKKKFSKVDFYYTQLADLLQDQQLMQIIY